MLPATFRFSSTRVGMFLCSRATVWLVFRAGMNQLQINSIVEIKIEKHTYSDSRQGPILIFEARDTSHSCRHLSKHISRSVTRTNKYTMIGADWWLCKKYAVACSEQRSSLYLHHLRHVFFKLHFEKFTKLLFYFKLHSVRSCTDRMWSGKYIALSWDLHVQKQKTNHPSCRRTTKFAHRSNLHDSATQPAESKIHKSWTPMNTP